jgi:hypothetical protein
VLARLAVVLAVLGTAPARAETCDPAEVAALRDQLTREAGTADTWNLAWRITFTTAAVSSAAVGLADAFPSKQASFYATAGKASIGALARWFMPLHVNVPAPSPSVDTCADLAVLRTELARVAKKERSLFWLGHVGAFLVNLGGSAYLWYADKRTDALLTFAIGYPVGLLANYTMPRGAWHRYRERTWPEATISVVPRTDGWTLSVVGAF